MIQSKGQCKHIQQQYQQQQPCTQSQGPLLVHAAMTLANVVINSIIQVMRKEKVTLQHCVCVADCWRKLLRVAYTWLLVLFKIHGSLALIGDAGACIARR